MGGYLKDQLDLKMKKKIRKLPTGGTKYNVQNLCLKTTLSVYVSHSSSKVYHKTL